MSDKVIHRLYWDFEREEAWLNRMAAAGLNLVRYTWGRYQFTKGVPGQWTYRIELLPDMAGTQASRKYLEFMEAAGVEVISTYMRWVFFRKPAAEGPFDLFSDLDSRLAHYRRVLGFYGTLTLALIPITMSSVNSLARAGGLLGLMAPLLAVQVCVFAAFALNSLRLLRRVRALRDRKRLYE